MYNSPYSLLYLIEILHQTTTLGVRHTSWMLLYLIEILHQTTTCVHFAYVFHGCILSKFYIKPQLFIDASPSPICCILSKFYIKPQQRVRHTLGHSVVSYRNSTSNHNGAQGFRHHGSLYLIEILHQTTTALAVAGTAATLYLIEILHQTTTSQTLRIP